MVNPSGGTVIATMLIALLLLASVWVFDPAARMMVDHASQGSSVSELEILWNLASMTTSSQYSKVGVFAQPSSNLSPEFNNTSRGAAMAYKQSPSGPASR